MRPSPVACIIAAGLLVPACTLDIGEELGQASTTTAAEAEQAATDPPAEVGGVVLFDVSELVVAVEDGVVAIFQTRSGLDPFLEPVEVPTGAGTGIVIDDQGHVLTNSHVIAGAERVFVTTGEGAELPAQVVADRPDRDLALVQVADAEGLVPIPLGSSEDLDVGDPVVAIGNALNLGDAPTVSVGIVSAKDRAIQVEEGGTLEELIQTDAAINPGNSGGPLLDRAGRVIGINTAVAGGLAQNIGFAISIDSVRPLIDDFLAGGGQAFLGVGLLDNDPQLAAQAGLSVSTGAVIASVEAGSAAAAAGLEQGDVVVEVNGTPVEDRSDLIRVIDQADPGDVLELEVVRGEERNSVDVTLGER